MLPFFSHKRRVRSCPVYHSTRPTPELWRSSWGLGGAGWPPTSLPGAALRSEGLPQNGTSLRLILWAHRTHYDRGLECLGPAPVPWAALYWAWRCGGGCAACPRPWVGGQKALEVTLCGLPWRAWHPAWAPDTALPVTRPQG